MPMDRNGTPAHYAALEPEPIDVIVGWGMGFLDGNVIKYLARYKHKGTPLEDLRKAAKYLEWLIEIVEGGEELAERRAARYQKWLAENTESDEDDTEYERT